MYWRAQLQSHAQASCAEATESLESYSFSIL